MMLKVTCVITTRNQALFLPECIESCLNQEVPAGLVYEVVVVDAGSDDNTREVIATYGDRVIARYCSNIGQSGQFEYSALLHCDILMFCDGDDVLHKNRLSEIANLFRQDQSIVLVGNGIEECDANGNHIRYITTTETRTYNVRESEIDSKDLFTARCLLGTSRMAVRRRALLDVLPFLRTVLFEADEYLFSLIPCLGHVAITASILTRYRLHGNNNFMGGSLSTSRLKLFRDVHEDLLESLVAARARFPDCDYLKDSITAVAQVIDTAEKRHIALTSRMMAVKYAIIEPSVLGYRKFLLWNLLVAGCISIFGFKLFNGFYKRTRPRKPSSTYF